MARLLPIFLNWHTQRSGIQTIYRTKTEKLAQILNKKYRFNRCHDVYVTTWHWCAHHCHVAPAAVA